MINREEDETGKQCYCVQARCSRATIRGRPVRATNEDVAGNHFS